MYLTCSTASLIHYIVSNFHNEEGRTAWSKNLLQTITTTYVLCVEPVSKNETSKIYERMRSVNFTFKNNH